MIKFSLCSFLVANRRIDGFCFWICMFHKYFESNGCSKGHLRGFCKLLLSPYIWRPADCIPSDEEANILQLLSSEEKVVVQKSSWTSLSQRWTLLVFQIWTFRELKALVVPVQVENMRWWSEGEVKRGKLRALICQSDKWRQKGKNDATKW